MAKQLQGLTSWATNHILLPLREPRATMTAGQITRLSWARPIRSFDELPPFYQARFKEIVGDPKHFPHTVLAPTFEGFLRRETEKLIFNLGETEDPEGKIVVLEKQHGSLAETSFWLSQVNYIELGQVLLKAWIRVSGISEREEIENKTLKFNSVTTFLFQPYIEMLRCGPGATREASFEADRERFRALELESFKFMNFGRRSLQPGERLEQFIFQPEVRTPWVKFGGRVVLTQSQCLAHLAILTASELILVRDDPDSVNINANTRYGGIWTFIPLRRLQKAEIEDGKQGMINLCLHMPGGDRLEVPFEAEKSQAIQGLVQRIDELKALCIPEAKRPGRGAWHHCDRRRQY